MGPLQGIRIVEFAGIGPGPFAACCCPTWAPTSCASTARAAARPPSRDITYRGRNAVALDLKKPEGVEAALKLIDKADALIEGFRPGVMERLGLGPDVCAEAQSEARLRPHDRLGPDRAARAGRRPRHQLHRAHRRAARASARGDKPVPPLNLVGDFGGGALYLAFGLVCRHPRRHAPRARAR